MGNKKNPVYSSEIVYIALNPDTPDQTYPIKVIKFDDQIISSTTIPETFTWKQNKKGK